MSRRKRKNPISGLSSSDLVKMRAGLSGDAGHHCSECLSATHGFLTVYYHQAPGSDIIEVMGLRFDMLAAVRERLADGKAK